MGYPANFADVLFEEGGRVTAVASVAVTGKKFVTISGNRGTQGEFTVSPPAVGGACFGVAEHDAAVGARTEIIREPGTILNLTSAAASGALAAGTELQADATGAVITLSTGKKVASVVDGSAGNGADVLCSIFPTAGGL